MREERFRFNAHECAGAFGDLGTLLPFVVGLIAVCGLDAAALFITLGLFNILCGLVFRVPMPLQPMKLIAVVAIAAQWTPGMLLCLRNRHRHYLDGPGPDARHDRARPLHARPGRQRHSGRAGSAARLQGA